MLAGKAMLKLSVCKACGKAYEAAARDAACPRCAAIDAVMPARQETPLVGVPHVVPESRTAAPAPLPAAPMEPAHSDYVPDTAPCPRCAETIKLAAKMCRFCNLDLTRPDETQNFKRPRSDRLERRERLTSDARIVEHAVVPRANPGIALVLSFFVCGLGQLYAGDVARGLAFFFGAIAISALSVFTIFQGLAAGWIIGWVGGTGFWIWNIIDAYHVASAHDGVSRPVRAWWRKRRGRRG